MATFDGKFLRGATGDLVFRKQGKKQVVQRKSSNIKMTQATFDAAFIFGRASTLALYIRAGVDEIVRFYDGRMVSRLTGECNQILQKAAAGKDNKFDFSQDYFSRLNGFEFNMESPVKNHLFAQPMVSLTEQTVTIDLPEMQVSKDLKFPANASYCIIAFSVTLFDLDNDKYETQEIQSFEIDLTNKQFTVPAQQYNCPGIILFRKNIRWQSDDQQQSVESVSCIKSCILPRRNRKPGKVG